jgi:hypothetical protein
MFVIKLALRPWKVAPFSQVFSALAVGFLLLLMGFLFWIQNSLDPVLDRLRHEQVITAYFGNGGNETEDKVVDSIRLSLGAQAENAEISVVEATQFLTELRTHNPELAREREDLGPEMHTDIPRTVTLA